MELLFLLLPIAAASGWLIGRKERRRPSTPERTPTFSRGLNYLLNEQPDKAIDVFLKLSEIDTATVETHLALGALFRRRGEVERAIRVHQNLVARSSLDHAHLGLALYELGRDYMLAGLFDRAESLFEELVERQLQQKRALRGLIEIYQAEKEWTRCLETAKALQRLTQRPLGPETAHYHCELAEQCLRAGNVEQARSHLLDAQAEDEGGVRASLLQARMELAAGDPGTAALLYRRLVQRSPGYLPVMLPGLLECWRELGRESVTAELWALFDLHPSPPLMLRLCEAIESERSAGAARQFLVQYLSGRADLAGVQRLLELRLSGPSSGAEEDRALLDVVSHQLAQQPEYQCGHCGFEARELHWQCPSCKRWDSIKACEPDPITEPPILRQRKIA